MPFRTFYVLRLSLHELRGDALCAVTQAQEVAAGGEFLGVHADLVVADGL